MASEIAMNMMRRRRNRMPVDYGEKPGHPHMEYEHDMMDRQHAYESAMEGLESLEKEGMPEARELHESLSKSWHKFVGEKGMHGEMHGMQPATKMSHRPSHVSKSPMDEHDEDLGKMYESEKYDASKE